MSETQTIEMVILRLRAKSKQVSWHESVIDNEHMNKKKSNKCCIFHRQNECYESSEESSDYDSSDDETDSDYEDLQTTLSGNNIQIKTQ